MELWTPSRLTSWGKLSCLKDLGTETPPVDDYAEGTVVRAAVIKPGNVTTALVHIVQDFDGEHREQALGWLTHLLRTKGANLLEDEFSRSTLRFP
jgi:hypothetical protein